MALMDTSINVNCSTYSSVFFFTSPALRATDTRPMQTSEILICKLCFVLSAVTTLGHVGLASALREIRQLYGAHQLLALYTNLLANICLLTVLCLPRVAHPILRVTFNALTHYNFLCSSLWTLAGAILVLRALHNAGQRAPIIQIHSCRKFLKCLLLTVLSPLMLVAPPLLLDLLGRVENRDSLNVATSSHPEENSKFLTYNIQHPLSITYRGVHGKALFLFMFRRYRWEFSTL